MANIHFSSKIETPDGTLVTSTTAPQQRVALGSLMKPMKDVWPAVDGVNGPLTGDTGITAGTPTTTGMTLYAWNSGVFNTQSQNWVVTPTGTGQNTSGYSACINASTPRIWSYGYLQNYPQESNIDFSFVTDATTITIFYYRNNSYATFSSPNYHDMQIYAEYRGNMRKLNQMPATSTGGGGLFYRTLTMLEARELEYRVMLPMDCWFVGVYINNTATIRKSANRPFIITNGDSWNEPTGNVLSSPVGGAYPTGTYRVAGLSQMIAEATGWAVALCAQGGTGEYNVNDGVAHPQTYTNANGMSTFHGQSRINDMSTKFFSRHPIVWTIGGWNDGDVVPAPARTSYRDRVLEGIDRMVAAKSDIQLLYSSIQPVDITPGNNRDLSRQGQADACALRPNNVIGFVNQMPMWPDTTMSGQRGANVNSSDTIHLHVKGAELVANWNLAEAAKFTVPLNYYNAMLAA
jgi:hypothetical protein